jgi:exodeoxyribonuclease V beta subunit
MKAFQPFQIDKTGLQKGVTLIEASAGTGKTFTIAGIVLRLVLEQRIPIQHILTVTYTIAATEELRDRVRKRLRNALDDLRLGQSEDEVVAKYLKCGDIPQAIRDLDLAVQNFDDARILTIHGFCQRVLRDYAFEAGVLFDSALLTDPTPLFEEAAQDFWRTQFYSGSALLPRLALAHYQSPAHWIDLLWQTVNHPDLVIIPLPGQQPAANIGKQIEPKLAEVAKEWSKSRAAITQILTKDTNLSRDKALNFSPAKVLKLLAELQAVCTDFRQANPNDLCAISRVSRSEIVRCTKEKTGIAPKHPFFDLCEDFHQLTGRYFHQLDHEFLAFAREELPRHKARLNILTYDDLLARLRDALKSRTGPTLLKTLGAQYRAALIDEFQDTDSVQYEIFRQVFSDQEHYLFFVGDPKQAMFRFRGADVFTYLSAASQATRQFTLGTNYRSEKLLLQAVNTLFSNVERPFLIEEIEYRLVGPPKKPREDFAELVEATSEAPFRFRLLEDADKPHKQGQAESQIRLAVVADIARLEASGSQLGNRRLKFGDMAILVRTNAQAADLEDLLRTSGIKSVLKSEESVFKTKQAQETLRVLEAVLEPRYDVFLRTALATSLFGLNAAGIMELDSAEAKWQSWLEKFLLYRTEWEESCFIAFFRQVLVDQGVRQRLIQYPGGERTLTNFLHIAELLHQAETEERLTPSALCGWLRDQMNKTDKARDEHQLRLESDGDAVLLATVHKSKGLEYPIVFCPYLWKAGEFKNNSEILFHDPANGDRLTLDLEEKRPNPGNELIAGRECMAESLRTLYVALTRAQNRCYVYAGQISEFEKSPLAHVLGPLSVAPALQALALKAGGAISVTVIDPVSDLAFAIQPSRTQSVVRLAARSFSAEISATQMIASFTGLTSGRSEVAAEEEPDRDSVEPVEPPVDVPGGINNLARFERGLRAGVFLHDILEHLDFQDTPERIEKLVHLKLVTHGIKGHGLSEALCAQLGLLLKTPLKQGLTLDGISLTDRLSEVEFSHPIASLQQGPLQNLFEQHGGLIPPPEFAKSLGRLQFRPVEGFMRGFIDLFFQFEDRYYIIDWKSNWLGPQPGDYDQKGIQACMLQHSYFLQYHLYTVAADLYLRRRIAGYEYGKHFGGIFYVFFRGLDPQTPSRGIFYDRPADSLVCALRQLLIGGLS